MFARTVLARPVPSLRPALLSARLARPNSTAALPDGTRRDPDHPHLYYHLFPSAAAPESIIVSFLPRVPRGNSATFLGTLPAAPGVGLDSFRENPRFRPLLHSAILEAITQGRAVSVDDEAATRGSDGYMHVTDARKIPPPGRVADADDLLATMFVKDGKVDITTYEPLQTYRLVSPEGVMNLPLGVDEYVMEVLDRTDREERGQ